MKIWEIIRSFRAMLGAVSRRRRIQLLVLLLLMGVSAIAEVVSLGAVIPFLGILADPEVAMEQPLLKRGISLLGLSNEPASLRWQLTVIFCVAAVAAGLMRFTVIYVSSRVNSGFLHELGAEVFRRTLYQPYHVHIKRNSSEALGGLQKVDQMNWILNVLMTAISSFCMGLAIIAALIVISPWISLGVMMGFGLVYGMVTLITQGILIRNSSIVHAAINRRVQAIQEGIGGIRDIILDHTQTVFSGRFATADYQLRRAQATNNTIGPSPRFIVEALGMTLIAIFAYVLSSGPNGIAKALPVLGALALGAQRLMPMVQAVYNGIAAVQGSQYVIADVAHLVGQPISAEMLERTTPTPFDQSIELENIHFRYGPELQEVLSGVSLSIPKGSIVGFVGETGSGKSTLLDLIMGLLEPTSGSFKIDGTEIRGTARMSWQQNIAHVPQSIFLLDGTFVENIAFGVPHSQIDINQVRRAAELAEISQFIEQSPQGYEGVVGERGVRLSGGQRQRIGIARALYKQANVLVLDEATSALDSGTETTVIDSILSSQSGITILMIAHRLSTLDQCNFIVELSSGEVASIRHLKTADKV